MKKGFTLVEVLVVMAIAVILVALATVSLGNINDNNQLSSAKDGVFTLLREARNATISSKDASRYGVHFESGRAVYFKGDTFTEPSDDNKEFVMPDVITISDISLEGGGSDIIFDRLTGATEQYGTVRFSNVDDVSASTTISIFSTGVMEVD